jgi:cysteine desulfuration protein SufE
MKTINEITQEIITEFDAFPTVDEKYAHLFAVGEELPKMDARLKSDVNKVQGCQSDLWFDLRFEDGRFMLQTDSDSLVIKGIAGLLVRIVENCPPAEVQQLNLDFVDRLNVWKLASERNNGLMAMLKYVKQQAEQALEGDMSKSYENGGDHA